MATYSVVAPDGAMYGPVDETGIAQWVREGRVLRETVLHCHETNSRTAAWTVPALQQSLGLSPQEVRQLLQSVGSPGAAHPATAPIPQQPYSPATAPIAVNYARADFFGGPPQPMISPFPVVGSVLLSIFIPLFGLIYYGLVHGNLPRRRYDDPGAGKAIGFMFIPIFSIYWGIFFWIRLCTRINDERTRVGLAPTAPRQLVVAMCWCLIGFLIPFVNFLMIFAWIIMSVIALIQIQTSLNELAMVTNRR